jgi:hypothetical protein
MEFLVLMLAGLWANPVPEANAPEQRKAEGVQTVQPSAPQAGRYTELKPPPASLPSEPTPPTQANEKISPVAARTTPEL